MKVLYAVLLVALLGSVPTVRAAEIVDGIEAVVHDSVISRQEVELLTAQTVQVLSRQLRNQPELFQKKMADAKKDNLDQLLARQLILHEFKTAGYNLPESVIDELVQERIHAKFGDRMTLTKTLQAQGSTYEKFRQQVREQFIVEALRQKNISSEVMISPHKVETYYLAHREEFKVDDEIKLRMIVLNHSMDPAAPSAQKLAEEILVKIKGGAGFAEMEAVNSQEDQRNRGGRWYERNQLTRGLADVAFSLQPGQYSGLMSRSAGDEYWICEYEGGHPTVARHYGVDATSKKENLIAEQRLENGLAPTNMPPPREFFLMLVEEKRPAHFKSLGEVRDEIEKSLLLDERERLAKQWIERLKKKTFVRYF